MKKTGEDSTKHKDSNLRTHHTLTQQATQTEVVKSTSASKKNWLLQQVGSEILTTIFQTILEIIEDKQDYEMPVLVYASMIIVYMLQIGGYVFQADAVTNMTEQRMQTLAYVSEISTLTFFLQLKGNDTETIECFAFMQVIMWVQILYVIVVAFLRLFCGKWYKANRKIFKRPNQILNIYFMIYLWLILLPYIEVFSGFSNCGPYSYLLEYTDPANCSSKPQIFDILGISGLVMTIINSLVLLFFYRNYEFNDSNILKRRFNPIVVVQLTLYFIVIFFYYVESMPISIKYISLHLTGATYIYDSVLNIPYQNYFIAKFYAACAICYEVLLVIITIWVYNTEFHDSELLYNCMIFSCLFIAVYVGIWRYKYENIMKYASIVGKKEHYHLDMYLEEIFRLAQDYQKSEYSKIKLFEIIIFHQDHCHESLCFCKRGVFKDEKNILIIEDVYKLIDSIFIYSLNSQQMRKDRDQFEHISLKFITYLQKYRNNPLRAFYEIKKITSQQTSLSLYFNTLQKILSEKIEENLINLQSQRMSAYSKYDQVVLQKNQVKLIEKSENIKNVFVPLLKRYTTEKINYLEKLRKGYQKIDELEDSIIKLSKFGRKIKTIYEQKFNCSRSVLSSSSSSSSFPSSSLSANSNASQLSISLLKLESIYKCTVLNEYLNSLQVEHEIQELKLKDLSKPQNQIHTINIMNKKVVHMLVSIAKDKGKILTNSSHSRQQLCRFLGRPQQDDKKINNIDLLMPNFIQEVHQELMSNLMIKGSSIMMEQLYHTFAQNYKGFVFPINLYLDSTFLYQDDFCINATLLKIDTPNDYIIFDREGKVLGISKNIFHLLSDCDEQTQEEAKHLKFENSNKQSKSNFNLDTMKSRIIVYFLIPKLLELICSHNQSVATLSDVNFKKLSTEQFIKTNLQKKQDQICYKERAKVRIPNNLMKLLTQFQNITNNVVDRPKNYTFTKQMTMNTESSNINIFYDNLKQFFIDMKRVTLYNFDLDYQNRPSTNQISILSLEWKSDSCKKTLNVKFNLYFDSLHYVKNNAKHNRQYYCMEIVDISQANAKANKKSDPFWKEKSNVSTTHKDYFQSENNFSSSDSSTQQTSFYRIDTTRFNQSPKRTINQPQLTSQVFSSKNLLSSEDLNMNNMNSKFGTFSHLTNTIQSPTKSHQLSNHLPNITKTTSEQILTELKSPKLDHLSSQYEGDLNSQTHREIDNALSPRFSERHNLKQQEDVRQIIQFKKSPLISSEPVKNKGSQHSIQELSAQYFSSNSIEEESIKTKHISSSKMKSNEASENKSITLDLNPLTKYIKINFEKQANWSKNNLNIQSFNESKQSSMIKSRSPINFHSQNTFSHSNQNARGVEEIHANIKKSENRNEKNQEILEYQLFGQVQGKSQSGSQSKRKDSQFIFELAHQKAYHNSVYQYFISMAFFIALFYLSAVILDITLQSPISDLTRDLNTCSIETTLSLLYSTQSLFSLLIHEIDIGTSSLPNYITTRDYLVQIAEQIALDYNTETQKLFQNFDNNLYLSSEPINTFVYADDDQQIEENSSQLVLIHRNLYNVITAVVDGIVNYNSMSFLLQNLDINNLESESRISRLYNGLNDTIYNLKKIQIVFIITVAVLVIFIFIASLPSMNRYHKYKQQLLLIATRMTQYECEKLLSILHQYNILLSDNYEEKWMSTDFVGVALTITKSENIKVKAQRKDQQLSALIVDQNLSKKKESLSITISLLTIVIFFAVIMVVIYMFNNNMSTPLALYRDSMFMTDKFYSQKTFFEQLISNTIIINKEPSFPSIMNMTNKINTVHQSLTDLQSFSRDFLSDLSSSNGLDSSTTKNLQNMFTTDLCQDLLNNNNYACGDDDINFSQGLQGLLQFQIEFLKQNDYLLLNTLTLQQQQSNYRQLQQTPTYYQILIENYIPSTYILKSFIQMIYKSIYDQYQSLLYIINSYLLGVSSFVGVLFLFFGILMGISMQNRINHLRFSLTFLPYEKSLDESTLYLLKGLQKI